MTRYRAYMHLGGHWHIADTFAHWLDAEAWMAMCERHQLKAIVVTEGGPIDRAIRETGKLPEATKQAIAREGLAIQARRVARPSPKNGGRNV